MSDEFDLYTRWLKIPTEHCPPNHYVLLDVDELTEDVEAIEEAAKKRTAYLHQIAGGPDRKAIQRLLGEVAVARRTLLNEESKADYDQKLSEPEEEAVEEEVEEDAPVAAVPASGSINIQIADKDRSPSKKAPPRKARQQQHSPSDSDRPTRRQRKQKSSWDTYKFHVLSASVLLLGGLAYWFVNKGGGRQAAVLPDKPSQSVMQRGAGFRQQTAATISARQQNNDSARKRQTGPEKKRATRSQKRALSGLNTSAIMQQVDAAEEPAPAEPNLNTSPTDAKNPAESGQPVAADESVHEIKLPADWDKGLKPQNVFTNNFEKVFRPPSEKTGFRIEDDKLWIEAVKSGTRKRAFLHQKRIAKAGVSIAIETNMKKTLNRSVAISLQLSGTGVTIQSTAKGIKILKRVDRKNFGTPEEIETDGGRVTLLLTRDAKQPNVFRWVVITGSKNLSGELVHKAPKTSSPNIVITCPNDKMFHKLWVSNFRVGKLSKSLPN